MHAGNVTLALLSWVHRLLKKGTAKQAVLRMIDKLYDNKKDFLRTIFHTTYDALMMCVFPHLFFLFCGDWRYITYD